MNNNQLSVSQAVTYAFNSMYTHLWYFIKFVLFVLAVGIAMGAVPLFVLLVLFSMLSVVPAAIILPLLFIFGFVFLLVIEGIYYGGIKVILAYYDNGSLPVPFKTFFSIFHFKTLLNLLAYAFVFVPITAVIYGLKNLVMYSSNNGSSIVALFYFVLIIPAIILIVRLGFGSLYIIDKNVGVITALKRSWNVTRNYFWPLLWITLIAYLIYQTGSVLPLIQEKSIIAFLVNLALICLAFMALPLAMLMIIYAYRRLQE